MDKVLTKMGSPCSPRWDDDWIAAIDAAESNAGRRICGARTLAGTPCRLESNHENGRCRFHGGFNLTGAQKGNRNAVIHGLYSRALRTCGPRCPLWNECPCAGDDVAALPPRERPICPYEATEYQVAVSDLLARLFRDGSEIAPIHRHLVQQTALLQVMLNRAAVALSGREFVETTTVTGTNQEINAPKLSPYLDAFLRISREYHKSLLIVREITSIETTEPLAIEQAQRAEKDTSLLPENRSSLDNTIPATYHRARPLIEEAVRLSGKGRVNHPEARKYLAQAQALAPDLVKLITDPDSESYIPSLGEMTGAERMRKRDGKR